MTFLELDIRTALHILFVGNLVIAAMLLAYEHDRSDNPYVLFMIGRLFQSIAFFLARVERNNS